MTTKRLFNYFLRGLLVTGPLALTVYALVMVFNMVDSIIPMREWSYQLFHVRLYGIGFLVVVAFTILMGYFSYNFLFNKLIIASVNFNCESIGGTKISNFLTSETFTCPTVEPIFFLFACR